MSFIRNLINKLNQRKQEQFRKKCEVIFNHTKNFYYDNFTNSQKALTTTKENPVDFSWYAFEAYRNEYAFKEAKKHLLEIIKQKRINDTYKNLKKFVFKSVEI